MTALTPARTNAIIVPPAGSKDQLSRLRKYAAWLDDTGRGWAAPDLAAYRDYLLGEGLQPQTVQGQLGTVRTRYKVLLLNRQMFFDLMPEDSPFERKKALADELIQRIENAINPLAAPLRVPTIQDHTDAKHLRLTYAQTNTLLHGPDLSRLSGWRDLSLMALALCTGARESELTGLDVPDLRQRYDGRLSLHIREGKGSKTRLVPYGAMDWCLPILDRWLADASIEAGPVFRGFRKGDRVRTGRLTSRAVIDVLEKYPVVVDGSQRIVRPHDLRRTYAKWLHKAGVPVEAIQANMGHVKPDQTWRYIGPADAADREPPGVFVFRI